MSNKENNEIQTGLIIPANTLPERLLLLPVYERPFFPSQVQPLVVDEEDVKIAIGIIDQALQAVAA